MSHSCKNLTKDPVKLALSKYPSFVLSYFVWMFHCRAVNCMCLYLQINNSEIIYSESLPLYSHD